MGRQILGEDIYISRHIIELIYTLVTNYHASYKFVEWDMINPHHSNEVPKFADFLGGSKPENQSELTAFNEIEANGTEYLFPENNLLPLPNAASAPSNYDFQENANNYQSLTLSMGSCKRSTTETSGDNCNNSITVEAAPRRNLDTFGQRTSIYRGVTRSVLVGRVFT